MKGWYITSIVVTIFYFLWGIIYLNRIPIVAILWFITGTISLVGIILYTKKDYNLAKTCFIISGILGFPVGILLIIFGYMIDN